MVGNYRRSNLVVGLRGGFNDAQNLGRIKPDRTCQDNEFNNIDPALTTLDSGDKRLMTSKPCSHVLLVKTGPIAGVGQCLAECHLPFASDRLRHAPHTFRDVASG